MDMGGTLVVILMGRDRRASAYRSNARQRLIPLALRRESRRLDQR
jgi:hypothetical protein